MKRILLLISFSYSLLFCQSAQWIDYFGISTVTSLAVEGQFLWAGNATNLTRLNTLNGKMDFYDFLNSSLPKNSILSISVDKKGNKWIGTEGGGLVKYDNLNWTVYNKSNSGLPNDTIHSIAADQMGNIWIGTNKGLAKFDGQKWASYSISNSALPDNHINAIAIDQKGNKWIGTNSNGLVKFNDTTWTLYNRSNSGIPDNMVYAVAVDLKGNIWVGTYVVFHVKGGLSKFDGKNWTVYDDSNSYLPNEPTTAIAVDSNGILWTGSRGLIKYNDTAWTVYNTHNSGIPTDLIASIAIDNKGNKWFGSSIGLVKYDGKDWTIFNTANSELPNNIITAIAIDKDNTKWFGTWFLGGVAAFDNQKWTYFDPSHFSYPEFYQYISAIAVDKKNVKWIATLGGGLIKYDGKTWTQYNTSNSELPDDYVKAIVVDKLDNKWIGTGSGLVKYDDKVWTIYNTSNSGIPGNYIAAIALDHEGNKWIACNGLTKYDDRTWTLYNTSNSGLPENDITTIAIDQKDNKWIGTYSKGLAKFDNKKWITYDSSNSPLSGNYISSIAIDSLGNKWIGLHNYYESHGGLAKLDSTKWTIFNASNSGLPHDDIYSVIVDQKENKWIGTYKGLAVYREDGVLLDNLPNIPVLISVKNNSKDQPLSLTLQWEKAAMADSYHLQLANDSLFKIIVLNDSLLTSGSRSIANLLEGRIYYWRLKAKNNLGESNWSNPWNFTTVLYSPDSLKVKVISAKAFQLSWMDRSGEEIGFIVERRQQSVFNTLDTLNANITSYIDSTIEGQTFYEYRVKAYNKYAVSSYSNTASIAATGVNYSGTIPTEYSLSQNYPNPFNPLTLIRYGLPKESYVRIVIYNSLGQMVQELILANQYAGFHETIFKAGNIASGVYFYLLEAKATDGSKDYREIRKMMLVK